MTVLAVGVAGVGALSLLNLLLAVGIVRRLREHSDRLATVGTHPAGAAAGAIAPAGTPVGAFSAQTSGGAVTHEDLADGAVVAFFSPTCKPCQEKLPGFVARAAARRSEEHRDLAVVVGDAEQAGPMLEALAPVVRTVWEEQGGPVAGAFAVRGFPSSARVGRGSDGRLVVEAGDVWLGSVAPAAPGGTDGSHGPGGPHAAHAHAPADHPVLSATP